MSKHPNSSEEDDTAAHDFSASKAAAYRLSTRRDIILDRIYEVPSNERLLKHNKDI
jgi:hypothetical protein